MEFLEVALFDDDFWKLLVRFAINLVLDGHATNPQEVSNIMRQECTQATPQQIINIQRQSYQTEPQTR